MPILTGMHYSTLVLWLVTLAQITSGSPGTGIPEDAKIFTVTFKDGQTERVLSAAVKADGKFITEFDKTKSPPRVELYPDTPWTPGPAIKVLIQNIEVIEAEPSIKRTQRYEDSGYEQIDTGNGKIWVLAETIARAERAKELQAALKSDQEASNAAQAALATAADGGDGRPGFARLWGRHVVILVTAVVFIVAAIKITF